MEGEVLRRSEEAEVPTTGKTDWARLDAMTDDDIARAVADDPDAAPILSYEEIKATYKPHPPRIKR